METEYGGRQTIVVAHEPGSPTSNFHGNHLASQPEDPDAVLAVPNMYDQDDGGHSPDTSLSRTAPVAVKERKSTDKKLRATECNGEGAKIGRNAELKPADCPKPPLAQRTKARRKVTEAEKRQYEEEEEALWAAASSLPIPPQVEGSAEISSHNRDTSIQPKISIRLESVHRREPTAPACSTIHIIAAEAIATHSNRTLVAFQRMEKWKTARAERMAHKGVS